MTTTLDPVGDLYAAAEADFGRYEALLDIVDEMHLLQPGTNIPILVEAASMNQRLKMMGYNPAREFTKKVNQYIEKGEAFL